MWIWQAPNHLRAIFKVFVTENRIVKRLCGLEIGFKVRGGAAPRQRRLLACEAHINAPMAVSSLTVHPAAVYFS